MLAILAAASIPIVTACQIVALGFLWRRYRMAGSGWWLLATVLIFLGTAGQAVEESGWRPVLLVIGVNWLCICGAAAEYIAARVLSDEPAPHRQQLTVLALIGLAWAAAAGWQAVRYGDNLVMFGWLRIPALLLIGVAETAIAVSLARMARREGTVGGYVAAIGYGILLAGLFGYPFSYTHPAVRMAGMLSAAGGFLLVGWGQFLIVLERRQADLLRLSQRLAGEVASATARAAELEDRAQSHVAMLEAHTEQAEIGRLAVDLAKDLLTSVDVLRQTSSRLHAGPPAVERAALSELIAHVLQDLSAIASGVVVAGSRPTGVAGCVNVRRMLESLLAELVPPTIGVMKAWPGPAVWLNVDETVLGVALHQLIRCQVAGGRPVERLSLMLETRSGLTLTLQQALMGRGDGGPSGDDLGLKLAQLAIRRLEGSLEIVPGYTGQRLVMRLPSAVLAEAPVG
jgi:hypothetical protein